MAPSLDFDWEVGVFRAVRALWRRLAPERAAYDVGRAARFDEHARRLGPLASWVAGEPVRLRPARREGGVRGRDLLLPPVLEVGPDPAANAGLYALRAVHAATIRRVVRGRAVPRDDIDRLRFGLEAVVEATHLLAEELPAFAAAWGEACAEVTGARPDPASLGGSARCLEQIRRAALAGHIAGDDAWEALRHAKTRGPDSPPVPLWGQVWSDDADDRTTGAGDAESSPPDGTEHEAPPVEDVRRVLLDPKKTEQEVLQHTFEKVETLDSWEGNSMMDDGADELDEHLEALDEVDLRELVRGGQEAHSVYKADLDLSADIPDVERIGANERGVPYDEWDHRTRTYRKGWCLVYPTSLGRGAPGWATAPIRRHRRTIDDLVRRLEDHRTRRRPRDRQLDGEQPDIDALVDHYGEVRAGRTGSPRVYLRQERHRRDHATTVLLDVSLSSDAWIDDRRVLDVSREAVLVLGEVAARLGDPLRVLAFASSTRNRCRVFEVCGWSEPWAVGRDRLGALEPQGYTRIGPALRHATADLRAQAADERLLLLVSDGKPNDYDRYEGRYGLSDVRMALREAERDGVRVHTLAIDTRARGWLPSALGDGRFTVLPRPEALLTALTEVYGRWTDR
jgi:nitric oxide reductase NorD protein